MNYGPHRETKQGDKTRIKDEHYWLKKKNGFVLRKWNGKKLYETQKIINEKKRNRYKEDESYRLCVRERSKNYKQTHVESTKQYAAEYRNNEENKKKHNIQQLIWAKNKYKTDINFKIRKRLRDRFYSFIKKKDKSKKTFKYLCSPIEQTNNHLESQFTDGMNWENMGTKPDGTPGWDIDHIRPCVSFDLKNEDEIYKCFHWSNLQPLWHVKNIKKSDTYDPETFEYEWKGREIGWVKKKLTNI